VEHLKKFLNANVVWQEGSSQSALDAQSIQLQVDEESPIERLEFSENQSVKEENDNEKGLPSVPRESIKNSAVKPDSDDSKEEA
jgi:hypothetical protein